MPELEPYQEALAALNKFRGYVHGGKTNLDRLTEAAEKKDFVWRLTGEEGVRAREQWQAEYQELINEDNRLMNRYRDLYAEFKRKPQPEEEPTAWVKAINPEAQDRYEWRQRKRETGRVVIGPGTTGDPVE